MGEIKFWNTPELVTHLLTFLDPTSILNLAHAHRMTVQILQNGSVWTKLIMRTRKRGEVRLLVGLMELLEDQESHQLELLQLIQERFPPTYVPYRLGPEETPHGPQFVTLGYSTNYFYSNLYVCSVSPLGFLLLEEVEGSQRLASFQMDPLEEPLMSILSSRAVSQEEQVNFLEIGTIRCNNNLDVVAFSTLVANSQRMAWNILEVGEDVEAEGWAELARVVQTLVRDDDKWLGTGEGIIEFNVSASRKAMLEGRREDLRSIWEATVDETADNPMEGCSWCVKSDGSGFAEWTYDGEWERLEEIMGMTEEEWWTQLEQDFH